MKPLKPHGKFIQISIGSDQKYDDRIYALDANGIVWQFDDDETIWTRLGGKKVRQRNFKVQGNKNACGSQA